MGPPWCMAIARGKNVGRQDWEGAEPLGVGGTFRGREASGVDPDTHRVEDKEGGREASGVEENPCWGRHKLFQDDSTPNRMGGAVESSQDDSTPNGEGGVFESCQEDSTLKEAKGTREDETPGSLTASRYQRGDDGRGQGRGDEKPPTARATRGQGPAGRDGVARRGRMVAPDEVMETAVGDGGAGHLSKHFDGADGATTQNCSVGGVGERSDQHGACGRKGRPWGHETKRDTDSRVGGGRKPQTHELGA